MKKAILMAVAAVMVATTFTSCGKDGDEINPSLGGTAWEFVGTKRRAVITFIDEDNVVQRVYDLDGVIEYTIAGTYTYYPPMVTLHSADGSTSSAKVAGDVIIFQEEDGTATIWEKIE